jgi:hypothetical protein
VLVPYRIAWIAGLVLALLSFPALARDDGAAWVVLGQQHASAGENAGVVYVNRPQTRYSKLRLTMTSGELVIYDMRLRYTNDLVEDVDIRQETRPGRNLIEVALRGNAPLRQIEIRFRALAQGASARYEISGEDVELKRILSRYEVVATETVSPDRDRIVIPVGRREGRITEFRLRALDDDITVRRMEITFPRGERQEVRVRDRIEAGTVSDAIDLTGDSRIVSEVAIDIGRRFGSGRGGAGRLQLLALVDRSAPHREPVAGIPPGWVQLGEQTAGFRGDRDVIEVGRKAGQFQRIALRVTENDIFLEKIAIVYGNGEADVKTIRQEVPANGRTGVIDLRSDRFIDRIELDYRSTGVRRGRAKVAIYGEYSDAWKRRADPRGDRDRPTGQSGKWVKLGEERAQMIGKDWDTIHVGRDKGRFRAIKIRIGRHDVQIQAIRVIYSNGEAEDLPFSGTIDDGRESPVLDLKGRDRFIERIEVRHKTKFNLKGEGVTEVWGLD